MNRMELHLLKNIITKLKISEVFQALSQWTFLTRDDVETLKSSWKNKQTKNVVSNNIVEFCMKKGGLRMDKVGDLDLIYTQMHSMKRMWSAYHLTDNQASLGEKSKRFSPGTIKRDLTKLLRLYFTARASTASVMLHNGLLWGRVYLPHPTKKHYQPTMCLYFVYYPQTPIIVMNGMKAEFEVFIKKCLLFVLQWKDIEEMSLNGHDLESIAELAINKFSDGGYQKFQLTHRPGGPTGEVRSRKRKVLEVDEHEGVTCEYSAEKRQRLELLDHAFGTTILPTLEKVEYKVELPYRGQGIASELQNQDDIFHSRVRFQGKNALEGIRNLAAAGYATVPLQKHLTCIPSRARNHFLLARKQRSEHTIQQEKQQRGADLSENRTINQSTPVRVQNRTASNASPERVENRTAQKVVRKPLNSVDKNTSDFNRNNKHRTKEMQQKVLKENKSFNQTKDNEKKSEKGGKKAAKQQENTSVHKRILRTNSQQKHSVRKAKR